MADYTRQKQSALRQIRDKGSEGTISSTSSTYNPATGGTTDVTTSGTARMVMVPYKTNTDVVYDDSLVKTDLALMLIAALNCTLAPVVGMKISYASKAWTIIGMTTIDPAGNDPILYKCVVTNA